MPSLNNEQSPSHALKQKLWQNKDFIQAILSKPNSELRSFNIPEQYWNEALAWRFLKMGYWRDLPLRYKKDKMAEFALIHDGLRLKDVPLEHRTLKLCQIANPQNPNVICFAPIKHLSKELRELYFKSAMPQDEKFMAKCLYDMPREYLTEKGWKRLIAFDPFQLQELKNEDITKILTWFVFVHMPTLNPGNFRISELSKLSNLAAEKVAEVKETALAEKIWQKLISLDGSLLSRVPAQFVTPELEEAAVSNYGLALEAISEHKRDIVVCTLAVRKLGRALGYVPEALKKQFPSLLPLALQTYGRAIEQRLSDDELTMENLELAISQDGMVLVELLKEYSFNIVEKLIKIAVGRTPLVIRHISLKYWSAELVKGVMQPVTSKKDSNLLTGISQTLIDEVFKVLEPQASSSAEFASTKAHILGLLTTTLELLGCNVSSMSIEDQLVELINRAWLNDANYNWVASSWLNTISAAMWTPAIVEAFVKKAGLALVDIPKELWTPNVIKLALRQNSAVFDKIFNEIAADEHIPEYCEWIVAQNGLNLRFVPEKYRSFELCLRAMKANPLALEHVPDHGDPARGWSIDEKFVEAVLHHYKQIAPTTLFTELTGKLFQLPPIIAAQCKDGLQAQIQVESASQSTKRSREATAQEPEAKRPRNSY